MDPVGSGETVGSDPSQGDSGGSAGTGETGDTGSQRRGSRTRGGRRAERRRIAERRLRRSVRENRGCLSSLTGFQQQVLELRAGVDGRSPQSRRVVAQTLDVPVDSVARAESRGLVTLRGRVGSGGCGLAGAPGSFGSIPPLLPLALAAPMPELTQLASLSSDSAAAADGAGAVLGDIVSSEDSASGTDPGAGEAGVAARVAADTNDGLSALFFLIAGLALVVLAGAFVRLRSRRPLVAQDDPYSAEWLTPAPWARDLAPQPKPDPESQSESVQPPPPPPPTLPTRTKASPPPIRRRVGGAAGIAASAIASMAARALVQRKRGSRRRRR